MNGKRLKKILIFALKEKEICPAYISKINPNYEKQISY